MKKGVIAMLVGLMIVSLFSTAAFAKGYDISEQKTCGLVGVNDIHIGLNEYNMEQSMKYSGKVQDPRPWFRNIWRSVRGVDSFSHSSTWEKCVKYSAE